MARLACVVCSLGVSLGLLAWLDQCRHRLEPLGLSQEALRRQWKCTDAKPWRRSRCGTSRGSAWLVRGWEGRLLGSLVVWLGGQALVPEACSMLCQLAVTSGSLVFDSVDSRLLCILAVATLTTVVERKT